MKTTIRAVATRGNKEQGISVRHMNAPEISEIRSPPKVHDLISLGHLINELELNDPANVYNAYLL